MNTQALYSLSLEYSKCWWVFFLRVRGCLVGDITLDRYTAQFGDGFLGMEDGVQDLELGGQDSI